MPEFTPPPPPVSLPPPEAPPRKKMSTGVVVALLVGGACLVGVPVVGIVAAVAIPNYVQYVRKARSAEAIMTVGAIERAQRAYMAEHDAYAPDLAPLDFAREGLVCGSAACTGKAPASYVYTTNGAETIARPQDESAAFFCVVQQTHGEDMIKQPCIPVGATP